MPSIFSTADFNRRLSPNDRQFRIAEILTKGATDTSPIQSPIQGISRLVQALLAKRSFDSATKEAKVLDLQRGNDLAQALRAGQGFANPGVAPGFTPTDIPAGATSSDALPAGTQLSEGDPNAMARVLLGSSDKGLQESGLSQLAGLLQRKNKLTDTETARKNELTDAKELFQFKQDNKVFPPAGSSSRPSAPIQNFAERQRLRVKFPDIDGKRSPQVARFDEFVRATKFANLGGSIAILDPENPSVPAASLPVTLKPGEEPELRRKQAAATAEGAAVGGELGDAKARLSAAEANFPRLQDAVVQLKALGEKATFTTGGRVLNAVRREIGMDPSEGAVARAKFIARVKNNVLPLLRQTFGAAFTAAEGDSLLTTFGDPNLSPAEKNAVLDALISDKLAELNVLRRQTGNPVGTGGSEGGQVGTGDVPVIPQQEKPSATGAGSGSVPEGLSPEAQQLLRDLNL